MGFINCLVYLVISGICVFFVGRIFPRKWIKENSFPFKPCKFENDGKIYDKLKIKKWKTKLPDASVIIHKIIPGFMPEKRIRKFKNADLKVLVKESCVAESTHFVAGVLGFFCIKIWCRKWSYLLSVIYAFSHLPFIIIQRYNRPRLQKLC